MEENTIELSKHSEIDPARTDTTQGNADNLIEDNTDYEALLEADLTQLRDIFPELAAVKDISELENPERYGALRDLGLTPEEAYRASTRRHPQREDTRAHLKSTAPKRTASPISAMSYRDMEAARELFPGISDAEIQRLYKKVTR